MFPAASPLALDLLTRLLRFDPAQRLSAADALSHPYFDLVKSRDYINAYKAKNQHIFDDELIPTEISPSTRVKQQSEIALRPNPMNVDIEKQGESPEFLKRNVSCFCLFRFSPRYMMVMLFLILYRLCTKCCTIADAIP